jgi:predicted metal-dependent RNase
MTKIYHEYKEYYDPDAARLGELFYRDRYSEPKVWESVASHGKEPAIYLCTSGNLDYGAAPQHFLAMAEDPKNAIFFVGWQNPESLGRKVCDSATGKNGEDRIVTVPIEERGQTRREAPARVRLAVERARGFSSHATGQQILEWFSRFRSVGDVYVVHGEPKSALSLVKSLTKMGLNARAPMRLEQFAATQNPNKPGLAPLLQAGKADELAPVDT